MPLKTVASIIEEARVLADIAPGEDFISEAMALAWLNDIIPELDLLMATSGYLQKAVRETVTVTGAGYYEIAEPLAIVSLHWQSTDGARLRRLPPRHLMSEYPILTGRTTLGTPQSYYAEVVTTGEPAGSVKLRIYFNNVPQTGTFIVTTIPPSATVTASASVNYPQGVAGWLVAELARRMLLRESTDTRLMDKLKKEKEQYILNLNAHRNLIDAQEWQGHDDADDYRPSVWGAPEVDWFF